METTSNVDTVGRRVGDDHWCSLVVASHDDPYGSLDFSRGCADAWGSRWVDIGPAGHINGDSGLGDWPEGKRLLESLTEAAHA